MSLLQIEKCCKIKKFKCFSCLPVFPVLPLFFLFGVIHPQFVRTLEDAVKYDEYMRRHATAEELEVMPTHTWGKKTGQKQGLFRIILEFFQPYDEIIMNDIGEDNLKHLTKLDDFIGKLSDLNDAYCTASIGLMRMNQRLQEPLKTSELIKTSKARSMQKKLLNGRDEKRHHGSKIPTLSMLNGKEPAHSNSLPTDSNRGGDSDNEYVGDFCALIGAGYSKDPRRPAPKPFSPQLKPSGDVKRLPCYTYALTGKCEAGATCNFSHDIKDSKAFLKRELRKILFAPCYEDTIMSDAKREGRIESKGKVDKSHSKSHSRGVHKQLDSDVVTEKELEKKLKTSNVNDSDSDDSSTTSKMSGSPSGSSHSKQGEDESGGSDNE